MFCTKCGSEVEDGSLFCTNCGARLTEEAPAPMFCTKCGSEVEAGSLFCTNCGTRLTGEAPPTPPIPEYIPPRAPGAGGQAYTGSVSFGKAIQLYFKNYANFRGRASRSEFWWAFLFNFLVSLVLSFIPVLGTVLTGVWTLVVLIPNLSIQVRRLHDTGKSWPYLLMCLIPLVGPIILLVFYCTGSKGDNRWGPGLAGFVVSGSVQYAAQYVSPATAPASVQAETPQEDESFEEPEPVGHTEQEPMQKEPETPALAPVVSISYDYDGETSSVEIREYPCLIGRDSSAVQVPLADPKVSRIHARLLLDGDTLLIEDLHSFNGTVVNGVKITGPEKLLPGDEIVIGTTRLSLEINT